MPKPKQSTTDFRLFFTALRKSGFVKEFETRSGGVRCVCFGKTVGQRKLDVQLWGDGCHRVSHYLVGRTMTLPSEFRTPEEMRWAIEKELFRNDQRRRAR